MGTLVLHLLLHYENVKKVSNRKISYFRRKIILLYEEKQPRQKWLRRKTVDLILSEDEQVPGGRVLLRKSRNTVD